MRERCPNERKSSRANQRPERRSSGVFRVIGGSWSVGPEALRWSSVNSRTVHGRRLTANRVVSRDKSSSSGCGTSLKARPLPVWLPIPADGRREPGHCAEGSYYDPPQFNDKSSVTTRPALPTHLSSPRKSSHGDTTKRRREPASRRKRRKGQALSRRGALDARVRESHR